MNYNYNRGWGSEARGQGDFRTQQMKSGWVGLLKIGI